MKVELRDIADIKTGIFAKPASAGEIVYLQGKHFDDFGNLSSVLHPDLKKSQATAKHLLKHNDILFAAKGSKNFAAVINSINIPAVASTTFFVITLCKDNVLPEYLAWFLNNSGTQNVLKRYAIGSSMVSISKAVLEITEIPVPSIRKQECILEIARLTKKENDIRLKIAELRQIQIQQIITNTIK